MSFADDKITRAKILELDGYEHLVKIAQGELPHGPFQELLDIRIEKVERGELTIKGKVLHAGKTTATSEATIVDADGNLFAHSTCTCLKIKLQD